MVEIAACIHYLLIIYTSKIVFIYEINLIFSDEQGINQERI